MEREMERECQKKWWRCSWRSELKSVGEQTWAREKCVRCFDSHLFHLFYASFGIYLRTLLLILLQAFIDDVFSFLRACMCATRKTVWVWTFDCKYIIFSHSHMFYMWIFTYIYVHTHTRTQRKKISHVHFSIEF